MKETFKDTETKQMRAVKAGEELTCDYGFDPNNQVIIIIIKFIVTIYRFFLYLQLVPPWFRRLWEKEQGAL